MPQRTGSHAALRDILQSEALDGIVLIAVAAAMILANGPLGDVYEALLHAPTRAVS